MINQIGKTPACHIGAQLDGARHVALARPPPDRVSRYFVTFRHLGDIEKETSGADYMVQIDTYWVEFHGCQDTDTLTLYLIAIRSPLFGERGVFSESRVVNS